jgi:hypothetical protein
MDTVFVYYLDNCWQYGFYIPKKAKSVSVVYSPDEAYNIVQSRNLKHVSPKDV